MLVLDGDQGEGELDLQGKVFVSSGLDAGVKGDLEEEIESLAEHPVEGGEVEEVGEGEGGAEQGLSQLGWHLIIKEEKCALEGGGKAGSSHRY